MISEDTFASRTFKIELTTVFFLILLLFFFSNISYSQENDSISSSKPVKNCEQQDIGDLVKKKGKPRKPPKKTMMLVLPNVSSNPANGFLLGVGFGFRLMVNKHFRTNINLDIGFGYRSNGFYLSGTETF